MRPETGPSVLYLIDSLASGGAERSLVEMAPDLMKNGVQLEVAVLHDRGGLTPELEASGVRVHRVGGDGRVQWLPRVVRLLRARRPDLLHTTLFESDVVGRSAAAVARIPVVTTLAGTPYGQEHALEAGIKGYRLKGAQLADAATARLVRRFHAVSRATADVCIARLRLDPAKVDVIPRGRDLRRLGHSDGIRRQRTRTILGVSPEDVLILFVGRQEPAKGLDVLVRAMPSVLGVQPDSVLLAAGREGRASAEILRAIDDMQLRGVIRLLGERDDVPDLLAASDLFVLPSYREGLPGAVLEAMAMRVPIVASDIPTVREAVPDERYAFLVPPGDSQLLSDAIARALSDSREAARRAERSRTRFEQAFAIETVARAMCGFYRRALSE